MAIQISVISGKKEEKKAPAGILRQTGTEHEEKQAQISLTELVSNLLAEVAKGVSSETEVEVEVDGIIELSNKDGAVTATIDVGAETPGARTVKLKFKSKVQPR
jgi:hypothetical protein